jgi:hypothetical protein
MRGASVLEYQIDFKDTNKWTHHLSTQGFVVVTNVMPDVKDAIGEFIKEFGATNHKGFIDNHDFPYSRFAWMCRAHPQVLEVYRSLYGLSSAADLITAIDRGSAISNVTNVSDDASEMWLHVDYPVEEGLKEDVYQSFLSLMEPSGAGLRVVPMGIDELVQHHARISKDGNGTTTFWCLSEEHQQELQNRLVSVISPAGSLTLWKCGLIHDNTTTVRPNDNTQPMARLVVYLCYGPKTWATEVDIVRRQKIFRLQHTTTHWPALYLSTHYAGMRKKTLLVDQSKILEDYPIIKSLIPINL